MNYMTDKYSSFHDSWEAKERMGRNRRATGIHKDHFSVTVLIYITDDGLR